MASATVSLSFAASTAFATFATAKLALALSLGTAKLASRVTYLAEMEAACQSQVLEAFLSSRVGLESGRRRAKLLPLDP